MNVKSLAVVIGPLLLLTVSGCAEFKMPTSVPWSASIPEPEAPTRFSAVWTVATLNQQGKLGVRGFGGRLMFYNDDQADPIVVDGTLTVYAFNDDATDLSTATPEKRFVYLPEQLADRYSKSKVGHSYSVWVPWAEVGGPQRKLTLVVRFDPRQGGTVMSDPSRQLLPGLPQKSENKEPQGQASVNQGNVQQAAATSPVANESSATPSPTKRAVGGEQLNLSNPIQQAAYKPAAGADLPIKDSMTTVTIDVPRRFIRHGEVAAPQDHLLPQEVVQPGTRVSYGYENAPPSLFRDQTNDVTSSTEAEEPEAVETAGRDSRSGRFVRQRFRARSRRESQPTSDPIRREPHPAMLPSRLPLTPR